MSEPGDSIEGELIEGGGAGGIALGEAAGRELKPESGHAPEGQADVVAAEPERVREHYVEFPFPGLVGHHI